MSACLLHNAHPSLFFPTTVGAGLLTIPVAVPPCLAWSCAGLTLPIASKVSQPASEPAARSESIYLLIRKIKTPKNPYHGSNGSHGPIHG